ncbi:polypyrimidine tract-binding protein 3-like isoform X4 [Liolophura sinensis]|uniref:polypyrimidine tract-binding protein 3-like isoform X4 n=1 Tax=Liolophura sinensis TaxID=3198878 RepID=UPI00315827C3
MYVCWYSYPSNPALPEVLPINPVDTLVPVCRKRGSEELLSHSPMVTNGTTMSPQHINPDMNNDAKKVKLDHNQTGGSRVVHIRGLPSDANELEVISLGAPFGKVTNILLLKQKSQALLEFGDEDAAANMVDYHERTPAQIRLKPVFAQLSNHKELKTDYAHSFQNASAQAAIQALEAVRSGHPEDQSKTILRVIVEQCVYPIQIEVLHWVFSKYGKVLKIITFTKNNMYQALIQFVDTMSANAAKLSLDGQCIYNGCCILKIDYSKLTNLNVKYNNSKSRDYTNPNLPTGDAAVDQAVLPYPHQGPPGVLAAPFAVPGMGATQLTTYGAAAAGDFLPNYAAFGGLPSGLNPPLAPGGFGMQQAIGAAAQMGLAVPTAGSSVVHVSNLDEEMVTPDALFTLFGVYGDVHRVKILFNKKDNALIQMAEPHQAQLAIAHLSGARVWGKAIRVIQSKHSVVQMPKEGQPQDAGLTKDFSNSPLHRFKRPGSKNCQNIYPPSAVLHLSNIPASVTEEQIQEAFAKHGTVKGFKFFPKDRRMALIQMATVDEAVMALIAMHNYQLMDNQHLRVSFSKSTL